MPVCSYVVMPRPGTAAEAADALKAIPGCEVHPAENADLLLMVTSTETFEEDVELRARVEEVDEVVALFLAFGEIDPETPVGDPIRRGKR